MSQVRDAEGNILNKTAEYVTRHNYSGVHSNVIDWFDKHPEDKPSVEVVDAPAPSGDDVPQVQLPVGPVDAGLVVPAEPEVPEPVVASDEPAGDVSEVPPSGDEL